MSDDYIEKECLKGGIKIRTMELKKKGIWLI